MHFYHNICNNVICINICATLERIFLQPGRIGSYNIIRSLYFRLLLLILTSNLLAEGKINEHNIYL